MHYIATGQALPVQCFSTWSAKSSIELDCCRPDGDVAVRLKVESVQQLIRCAAFSSCACCSWFNFWSGIISSNFRCLRSSFDPEGQRIILQEEVGGPDVLVVDDVTSLNWPKELSLTMQEKFVGGSNTVVFMLRPSQWILFFQSWCSQENWTLVDAIKSMELHTFWISCTLPPHNEKNVAWILGAPATSHPLTHWAIIQINDLRKFCNTPVLLPCFQFLCCKFVREMSHRCNKSLLGHWNLFSI